MSTATEMTADGYIWSSTVGTVVIKKVLACCLGATEGDVIVIREGGASGKVVLKAAIPTDNCNVDIDLSALQGGGLTVVNPYYSELATAAGKIETFIYT